MLNAYLTYGKRRSSPFIHVFGFAIGVSIGAVSPVQADWNPKSIKRICNTLLRKIDGDHGLSEIRDRLLIPDDHLSSMFQVSRTREEYLIRHASEPRDIVYRGITFRSEQDEASILRLFDKVDSRLAPAALDQLHLDGGELADASIEYLHDWNNLVRSKDGVSQVATLLRRHTVAASSLTPFVSFAKEMKNALPFTSHWHAGGSYTRFSDSLLVGISLPNKGMIDREKLAELSCQMGRPMAVITPEDEILHVGTVPPDQVVEVIVIREEWMKGGMSVMHDIKLGGKKVTRYYRDPNNPTSVLKELLDPEQFQ